MPNDRIFIGDTGTSLIFGEWVPGYDPATESAKLMQLANAIGDWSEPMVAARQIVIEDTRRHFEEETDPWGDPWKALNEEYRSEKLAEGFPDEILVRTGELERAATSEYAYIVTDREILFNPSGLPFYGTYHQSDEPRTKLPRRAFIGVSEEAENDIEAVFLAWINRTTDVVYPPHKWRGGGGGIVSSNVFLTSAGEILGTTTNIKAFGGGRTVRGPGGRFIGVSR